MGDGNGDCGCEGGGVEGGVGTVMVIVAAREAALRAALGKAALKAMYIIIIMQQHSSCKV
jgi:hypothetical protein